MKKKILLLLILMHAVSYSQQKTFLINWQGSKVLETADSSIEVPFFENEQFNFNYETGIWFISEWNENNVINENSVSLSGISYSTISQSDLKQLPLNTIPKTPKVSLRNSIARSKRTVHLEISPIINDKGVYKKITGFSVSYNVNANRNGFASRTQELSNSVLANGDWYRFYVDTTGVFKITKDFLNQLGVDTNVDPRTLKVFGNGGDMLPLLNSSAYPNDLAENAIKFVGEEDGVFNNEDYILFYGEGPNGYNEEYDTNINPYIDKSYYYINVSNGLGKRMQPLIEPTANANLTVNTFQDYQYHELDEYNLIKAGRRWFGDRFDIENEKAFNFQFPNLVSSVPAKVKIYTAAVATVSTSMSVKVNGSPITTFSYVAIADPTFARGANYNGNLTLNSSDVSVNLNYSNNGNPSALAYVDYISIEATRALEYVGNQIIFKNKIVANTSGIVEYILSGATPVKEVWDISNKFDVSYVQNQEGSASFHFKASAGELKPYITVTPSDYFAPKRDGNVNVANQNIKGTIFKNNQGQFEDVDYIIITPANLNFQAQRLAQINRNQYNLNVKVVNLEDVYTEFSSGNQDVGAIRNLVKYVYQNPSSESRRLKYLCLFGDGSFDYKQRLPNNSNIVPVWESYESFSLTSSFVSDDFYGMMDENEGLMLNSDKLDIAVGRMLVETPQRAKEMVDKVELYYQNGSYGSWRNNFIVVSDDADVYWEKVLQETTDAIGNAVTEEKPFINVVKIHSDAFLQESSSSGQRYPKVNKAFKDAIEVGALVVNYFGHGGEDGLARERIFDKVDTQETRNLCKFNCFVTVTCEYTRFDNPLRPTAGEYTYWNKQGGSIGLITTTRQIFVTVGVSFNVALEKYLFAFGSNEYPSMAEALRLTKNDPTISGLSQRRLVFFIGDPAMKLAFPKPEVRLTKINDVPLGVANDTLKSLSKIKLSGQVVDASGNLVSNYNGVLTATIFDKNIQRQTLSNDQTCSINVSPCPPDQIIKLNFTTLGEKIFIGQASVQNGLFDFDFVVPRDIGVPVGNGKVSFYAKTDNPLQDQAGANFDIKIGGINENAEEDNIGPVVQLYMNDENFVSGGITNESPTLLAKLQDDNGINTASGIGHDILAIIDGDETNPFILNDYYKANVDDYKNGKVSYPFRDLEPGLHTLTLKAWDVYNNSSIAEIQFVVHDKDEELVINNVLNYPNPFINYTEFWFNHNSSEPLDVSIQIFTVSGKLVRTLNGQTSGGLKSVSTLSKDIVWDGRDDFGDKIGKGVYVYKLKVRSNQLNKQVEKIEKLVIL